MLNNESKTKILGETMKDYIVLFNPYADNGNGEQSAKEITKLNAEDSYEFVNVVTIKSYVEFFETYKDKPIIIAGGDGTLNRFVNDTKSIEYANDIYYFASGSGNDFLRDLGKEKGTEPVLINEYIKKLPEVTVKDVNYKFLNNVGFGIDGYCCEVADKIRETGKKEINYTAIAIKGLLFHFKPVNAKITVDGKEYEYKNVWLAPTMNGKYYGGGMMASPNQDRLDKDGKVSVMVMYKRSKIKTLLVFSKIFKGEHVKYTKMVQILEGKNVKVEFDRPTALQIDGETVLGVTEYTVRK